MIPGVRHSSLRSAVFHDGQAFQKEAKEAARSEEVSCQKRSTPTQDQDAGQQVPHRTS